MAQRGADGKFIKGSGSGKNRIVDTDKGLNAMVDRLARAAGSPRSLSVGILEAQADMPVNGPDGAASELTISQLGEIHEFGLGVPQRSFIRDWFDETEAVHKEQFSKMAQAIVKGQIDGWDQGLARLGLLYVGEIQRRIKQGIDPPLEDATIKAKNKRGSADTSTPLIDTGQLWTSITSEVT